MLVKNHHFSQNLRFWSKIKNCGQKSRLLLKKSRFRPTILKSHRHKIFNSYQELTKVVMNEMKNSVTNGSNQNAADLALWLGTFGHLLENGNITDYIVGLSASAGQSVWRHIVEKYILQLENEQNFTKDAVFFNMDICTKFIIFKRRASYHFKTQEFRNLRAFEFFYYMYCRNQIWSSQI